MAVREQDRTRPCRVTCGGMTHAVVGDPTRVFRQTLRCASAYSEDVSERSALEVLQQFEGLEGFYPAGWQITGTYRKPWGRVPMTAGGKSLDGGSREYMDRLLATQRRPDPMSRRHHYVPETYLKRWSFDNRRVWNLDTVTGHLRPLPANDVCVEENFYRVIGPDGEAHNRVEAMFGIVDTELRRIQGPIRPSRRPGRTPV